MVIPLRAMAARQNLGRFTEGQFSAEWQELL
jgi:hypothetical protein